MNLSRVWKTVQEDLRVEIPTGPFNTFIVQSGLAQMDEADNQLKAVLETPTLWHQEQVERRFFAQIREALERVTEKKVDLKLIHRPGGQLRAKPDSQNIGPLFSRLDEDKITYRRAVASVGLRPDFSFEQFAVSSTNEMAYAAAQAVSDNPGKAYQLLFLYGGVGVGKTHLMQAIGHQVLERNPAAKAIYLSGEEFTNEIIEAIRYKTTVDFRKKYRPAELLLIDDIQFIGGKDRVQEEFFHTFNANHRAGGQIVLTSDQLPHEIHGLEDRLRSRFEGGLTVDIQEPNFELRAAILLIKAKNLGLDLKMEAAQLVAANIEGARGLEGFLRRLMVESSLKQKDIDEEMVTEVLGSTKNGEQVGKSHHGGSSSASPAMIIKTAGEVFGVKESALRGQRRKKEMVAPRHLAMYLLRQDQKLAYEEIGALFGNRDHTTVLYAVEKIRFCLPNDERLRGGLEEIRKRLRKIEYR